MKQVLILAGILIGISAFFYFRPHTPEMSQNAESATPGREEVCVSGDIRLSMNSYEALRSRFPGISPIDRVRVGLYAQWLVKSAIRPGPHSLGDAARCIRALMKPFLNPSEAQEIKILLEQSFGIASLEELGVRLHDAWKARPIEWNPSLLKEYGIESPESLGNSG